MFAEHATQLDEAVSLIERALQGRARQPVVPRQSGLGVRPAGQARSGGSAADHRSRKTSEELRHSGTPRRPAAQAESSGRRDRRMETVARGRRRFHRSRENPAEDRRRREADQEIAMVLASRALPAAHRALLLVALVIVAACGRTPTPSFRPAPARRFPSSRRPMPRRAHRAARSKTLTVSMALSGKAGRTRLRGRVDAGFARALARCGSRAARLSGGRSSF